MQVQVLSPLQERRLMARSEEHEIQKRYDALFELYVQHIHSHRLGTGNKCDGCVKLANELIKRELNKEHIDPADHEEQYNETD